MKLALIAVAAVSAAALSTAAQAQAVDWSGFYVGGQIGAAALAGDDDTVRFDTNLDGGFGDTVRTAAGADAFSPGFCTGAANGPTPAGGCSSQDRHFEYGVRGGYDRQYGAMVVGVLGEVSFIDLDDSVSAFSTTPARYAFNRNLQNLAAVRARVGYAMGPNLAYATAGAARGKVRHSFATSNTANTFVERGDDDVAYGFQVGAGVERQFTSNIAMGLEYVFTRLDDADYRVRAQGPAPATNPFILVNGAGTDFRRANDDFDVHSVRLTATYRY